MSGLIFLLIYSALCVLISLIVYFFCSYVKVYYTHNDGTREFVGVLWKSARKYTLYNDFPPLARKIGYVDQQGVINIEKENSQHNYVSTPCGTFNNQGEILDINGNIIAKSLSNDKRISSVVDIKNKTLEIAYVASGYKKVPDMMLRAAAFGALWSEIKNEEKEAKSDVRIGLRDLALPSTVIFLLFYVPFGFLAKIFSWLTNIGDGVSYVCWMMLAYFMVNLILYLVKSYFTMRNRPLTFFTGLINRNVGVQVWNVLIIIISAIGVFTSTFIADFTIIPVFASVLIGFLGNIGSFNGQWNVVEPVSSWGRNWSRSAYAHDGQTSSTKTGIIDVEYDWSPILKLMGVKQVNPEKDKVSISILESDLDNLKTSRVRQLNPFRSSVNGVDFDTLKTNANEILKGCDDATVSYEKSALEQIIQSALKLCAKYSLADFQLYDLILHFCQSESIIKYVTDDQSDKIGKISEYFRYPLETLYDREGDCDCKSVLAYKIFELLNANPRIAIVKAGKDVPYNHAAVVLRKKSQAMVQIPSTYQTYDDARQYIFCEVTGEGYKPGNIPSIVDVKSIDLI